MKSDLLDLILNKQYECLLVDLPRTVRSDRFCGPRLIANPGRYMAFFNRNGAASVYIPEAGALLGVKPDEFTFAPEPGGKWEGMSTKLLRERLAGVVK